MLAIIEKELFHVHTYRCKHAQDIPDKDYILAAIDKDFKGIWFCDHAPFPGNPFGNRMDMEELSEYIDTLSALKMEYAEKIAVHIGLEAEYFPQFDDYYKELKNTEGLEFLGLGQHMYQVKENVFSFSLGKKKYEQEGVQGRLNAIIDGMKTGYFDFCLHPDRPFRSRNAWLPEDEEKAKELIQVAIDRNIPLEKNLSSYYRTYVERKEEYLHGEYWAEFWDLVPDDAKIVIGYDAHETADIDRGLDILNVSCL